MRMNISCPSVCCVGHATHTCKYIEVSARHARYCMGGTRDLTEEGNHVSRYGHRREGRFKPRQWPVYSEWEPVGRVGVGHLHPEVKNIQKLFISADPSTYQGHHCKGSHPIHGYIVSPPMVVAIYACCGVGQRSRHYGVNTLQLGGKCGCRWGDLYDASWAAMQPVRLGTYSR